MLLQNGYRIISLLLVSPLPLNWFQNVSFSIGINKDKIVVKVNCKSMMELFCKNIERLLAVNYFCKKSSLNKKKFLYKGFLEFNFSNIKKIEQMILKKHASM